MTMEGLGARLLGGIEEESLEDLLTTLRKALQPHPDPLGLPALDNLCRKHNTNRLELTSRGLPLLYHIINTSITNQNGVVALIDLDHRFDINRLHPTCDLQHLHIFRPEKESLKEKGDWEALMQGIETWMLGGEHGSMEREWVITAVSGVGGSLGMGGARVGNVVVGWRGWLRVEREEVPRFGAGMSVEEALRERGRRQEVVDRACWRAVSEYGEYVWKED